MPDPTFNTPITNPFGLNNVGSRSNPMFVDIDADGDLDVFIGSSAGNVFYRENTGNSTNPQFGTTIGNPFGLTNVGTNASPFLVDIDSDGDLDAFISNQSGNTIFFRNTGNISSPAFTPTPTTNPFGLQNVGSFARASFVDIDGDGDLDAFIGNGAGNTIFFRNTGNISSPAFTPTPTTNPFGLSNIGQNAHPFLVDIDEDGDLDAFIGNGAGNTIFFRNTGNVSSPAFTPTPTTNPFGLQNVGGNARVTFADIDGDGDLDALIGNGSAGQIRVFIAIQPPGVTIALTGSDTRVTEGGSIDDTNTYTVVINSQPTEDVTITLIGTVQVTPNISTVTFTTANWNVPQTVTVTAVDDTVGEGVHYSAINATVTSSDTNYNNITVDPVRVIIEDNDLPQEDPTFRTPTTNPFGLTNVGGSANPTFVDIDGDGDLDVFIGTLSGNTIFYRNTGTPSTPAFISENSNFGLTNVSSSANPTFVDIDGDGDKDAFIGEGFGNTIFYRNTGTPSAPSFSSEATNFGLTDVGSFASPTFGDIDGDGDLDIFIGEFEENTIFYRNTGTPSAPSFSSEANNFELTDVGDLAKPTLIDIDGDGDKDAFIGNVLGDTIFYRNIGTPSAPSFSSEATNFGLTNVGFSASPTLIDIDGDGDLDAFIGNIYGDTIFFLNQDNLPPVVDNPIIDRNTFERVLFDFTVPANTFSDPDVGDTLTYTATLADDNPLPSWLTFDPNTQTFSGTPTNGDIGPISVKVTATDTGSLSVSDTFVLWINPLQTLVTNSTGGNDTLTGGVGFNIIDGGGGNDFITGNDFEDTLRGGSGNDTIKGLDANDLLDGGSGNDRLKGGDGNDIINAGSGNDTLIGGSGNDTLTGGSGADSFLFNSSGDGVDTITDFKVTEDKIWINSSGFGGSLPLGTLPVEAFVRGSSPTNPAHRFIYNPSNGLLSFDADGVVGDSIELAQLRSGLGMTNANIIVFGDIS